MFVANAGSDTGRLRTALNTGSYGLAKNIAAGLPHVPIADAIRLTVLAAQNDPKAFEPMARRCLARLIEERQLSVDQAIWAAQRFQDVREGTDGETGLLRLAGH
jgi:hypothetical protein